MQKDNVKYTYLIGWTKHNKFYYGVRLAAKVPPENDLWVKYFTSSKYVKQFVKENGNPDIVQVRRTFVDEKSARKWELKVLTRMKVKKSAMWLNRCDASYNGCTDPKSQEHKGKIAQAHKGKPKSTDHRNSLSKAIKGTFTWVTDGSENFQIKLKEIKEFMRNNPQFYIGFTHAQETRDHMSVKMADMYRTGKRKPPDNTGRIPWNSGLTKETDARICAIGKKISVKVKGVKRPNSSGSKNGMYGKTISKESMKNRTDKAVSLKRKWYTDGLKSVLLSEDEIVPSGFVLGRTYTWNTHPKTDDKTEADSFDQIVEQREAAKRGEK